jgi:cytochrome c oxidase subunit 1
MVPSPSPEHNFDTIPVVESEDEWWHRKYGYDENKRVVRIATVEEAAQDGSATGVHLPAPSFWPLVLALGLPLIGYGLIFNLWLAVVGGALTGLAIYSWALEPVDDPDADHGHGHDDHHDDDDGGGDDHAADDSEPVTAGAEGGE